VSGNSGSNARDKKMKKEILETDKFPTIVFAPQKVLGYAVGTGGSQVQMQGVLTLHGQQHPMTLVIPVRTEGSHATAQVHFEVPYVQWGLKDPSTLFLRVNKTVEIDVRAAGTLTSPVISSQR
jgi:polyisoprenoid-binding protein YceI